VKNGTETGKSEQVPDRYMSGWLTALDGRLSLARELRARYSELTDDLGGADRLSYAQRSLCERALWLEYWLTQQERELASGKDFDAGKWTQACNALSGLFAKLGLQRKVRDVPDLATFLAKRERSE
jgi:hypothetical protein